MRPSSPSSPTPSTVNGRPSTPTHSSPGRGTSHTPNTTSPSKLKQSYTAEDAEAESHSFTTTAPPSPTPTARPFVRSQTEPPPRFPASPQRPNHQINSGSNNNMSSTSSSVRSSTTPYGQSQQSQALDTTLLSRLPSTLVHTLRETFTVLDTNSDNHLTPSDITETFASLSLPQPSPMEMAQFFPHTTQSISLPVFLNTLADLLAKLSPMNELMNAFSAFDEEDSGEVDVAELRGAVLNTAPEEFGGRVLSKKEFDTCMDGWTGRKAFVAGNRGLGGLKTIGGGAGSANGTPSGKKGDVFRYHDFVGGLMGGNGVGVGVGPQDGQSVA